MHSMQVFIADIDSISKNPDDYLALLSPEDKLRATKFQKHTRKLQFILGHLMVNSIGKKYTSIAHKDRFVVVASAQNTPVGIDIENVSVERDFVAGAALAGLKAPKTLFDFYKFFTESEATYKLDAPSDCTRFIMHDDYLICIVSTRQFVVPRLTFFDAESILTAKKK